MTEKIALIGFGEAGRNIGSRLVAEAKARVSAYDLLAGEKPMAEAARAAGVDLKTTIGPALEGASIIFSLVTASSAIDALRLVHTGHGKYPPKSGCPTGRSFLT